MLVFLQYDEEGEEADDEVRYFRAVSGLFITLTIIYSTCMATLIDMEKSLLWWVD